ncbi:MAG: alpha-L-rhamnosidase N-terminal domain-containing protein, partial [Bacteroidales bacterium]|nr:alpha-L-rhamnosidase N-terminal domain-containing protein [Bacteroidales bacterium]
MRRARVLLLAVLFAAVSCNPFPEVYDLRCEGLREPLAIDSPRPHFSWKIRASRPVKQLAYEIEVGPGRWSSGKVVSPDQVMVPYQGLPLHSRDQAWWRVRVWTSSDRVSRWSEPQRFGVGILEDEGAALAGAYIGAVPGEGRSPWLRKRFTLDSVPDRALLHVNSLGFHEVWVNGRKLLDDVLSPAVSQLDKRSLTVTYDLTPRLRPGENELRLWLGSGWYKSTTFGTVYDGPLVKAELDFCSQSSA